MPKIEFEKQVVLPGFEGYVCNFDCNHCPLEPGQMCYWDDPGPFPGFDIDNDPLFEAEFHAEEFEWWRFLYPWKVKPEPNDKNTLRCPRCYSVELSIQEQSLFCNSCEYNEPLIDFPDNIGRISQKKTSLFACII